MGGYGSTRWNWTATRQDIDALLFLDIRRLHRIGALNPGAVSTQRWTRRGEPSGEIVTIADRDRQTVTVSYQTRRPGEEWQPINEPIDLDWTPCTYGGERPWFRCPGCGKRCAVLFSVNARFRCRGCHQVVYSSTQESEFDRCIRRAEKLRARLGDTSRGAVWRTPTATKPTGMHWNTYARLRNELEAEIARMESHLFTAFARMERQVQKLTR